MPKFLHCLSFQKRNLWFLPPFTVIKLILFKFVQRKDDQLTNSDCYAAQREQNQVRSRSLPCLLTTFRDKTVGRPSVELALELLCSLQPFVKYIGLPSYLLAEVKKTFYHRVALVLRSAFVLLAYYLLCWIWTSLLHVLFRAAEKRSIMTTLIQNQPWLKVQDPRQCQRKTWRATERKRHGGNSRLEEL